MSSKALRRGVLTPSITLSLVFGFVGFVGTARSVTITRVSRITGPAIDIGWGGLRAAGDVNGDGYADVLIGAGNTRQVWLYLGSPTGLAAPAAWSIADARSMTSAGDVNNDGFDDIIIGNNRFGAPPGGVNTDRGQGGLPSAIITE